MLHTIEGELVFRLGRKSAAVAALVHFRVMAEGTLELEALEIGGVRFEMGPEDWDDWVSGMFSAPDLRTLYQIAEATLDRASDP